MGTYMARDGNIYGKIRVSIWNTWENKWQDMGKYMARYGKIYGKIWEIYMARYG